MPDPSTSPTPNTDPPVTAPADVTDPSVVTVLSPDLLLQAPLPSLPHSAPDVSSS